MEAVLTARRLLGGKASSFFGTTVVVHQTTSFLINTRIPPRPPAESNRVGLPTVEARLPDRESRLLPILKLRQVRFSESSSPSGIVRTLVLRNRSRGAPTFCDFAAQDLFPVRFGDTSHGNSARLSAASPSASGSLQALLLPAGRQSQGRILQMWFNRPR